MADLVKKSRRQRRPPSHLDGNIYNPKDYQAVINQEIDDMCIKKNKAQTAQISYSANILVLFMQSINKSARSYRQNNHQNTLQNKNFPQTLEMNHQTPMFGLAVSQQPRQPASPKNSQPHQPNEQFIELPSFGVKNSQKEVDAVQRLQNSEMQSQQKEANAVQGLQNSEMKSQEKEVNTVQGLQNSQKQMQSQQKGVNSVQGLQNSRKQIQSQIHQDQQEQIKNNLKKTKQITKASIQQKNQMQKQKRRERLLNSLPQNSKQQSQKKNTRRLFSKMCQFLKKRCGYHILIAYGIYLKKLKRDKNGKIDLSSADPIRFARQLRKKYNIGPGQILQVIRNGKRLIDFPKQDQTNIPPFSIELDRTNNQQRLPNVANNSKKQQDYQMDIQLSQEQKSQSINKRQQMIEEQN